MATHEQKITLWLNQIDECQENKSKLTQWEAGFIQSISEYLDETENLTHRQAEMLNTLWERVTA